MSEATITGAGVGAPLRGPSDGPTVAEGSITAGPVAGIVLLIAGIALGYLGAAPPFALLMVSRYLLAVAGSVVAFQGITRLGRVMWGPGWDAPYWLSLSWLALIVIATVAAPILPLKTPSDSAQSLLNPSMARPDLLSSYSLGTNNQGLDILSRVIWGGRVSLLMSLGAVAIGMAVGGTIGILAGYLRRLTDAITGVFTNSLLAFPPLVLLLALVAVLSPSPRNIAIALGILIIPANVRLARANTILFAEREFVHAARSIGAKRSRVMVRELLPNVILPLISYGFVIVAALIVAEASLSFLGLGIQQPSPSWGNMIAEGLNGTFETDPHVVVVPGLVLFTTVFAFNVVGERLRASIGGGGA